MKRSDSAPLYAPIIFWAGAPFSLACCTLARDCFSDDALPAQLAASFNRQCAGAPSPTTIAPSRFHRKSRLQPAGQWLACAWPENSVPRLNQGLLLLRRFAAMLATLKPGCSIFTTASTCIMAFRSRGASRLLASSFPSQFGVEKPQRVDGLFRFDFGKRHPKSWSEPLYCRVAFAP